MRPTSRVVGMPLIVDVIEDREEQRGPRALPPAFGASARRRDSLLLRTFSATYGHTQKMKVHLSVTLI